MCAEEVGRAMMDTMVVALEAAWELDPVRLEDKLWGMIDRTDTVEKLKSNGCRIKLRKAPIYANSKHWQIDS